MTVFNNMRYSYTTIRKSYQNRIITNMYCKNVNSDDHCRFFIISIPFVKMFVRLAVWMNAVISEYYTQIASENK